MPRALVVIADGTEEIEVMAPVDILRRASMTVDFASVMENKTVKCAHNVVIVSVPMSNSPRI